MASKKTKKEEGNNTVAPTISSGTYEQQMANTIALQQQQLQALSSQMYPGRGSNLNTENNNIITVGQSAPVVDGGIAGNQYYSASPTTFVAPNMESRNRVAAAAVNDYKTNENFINNFDSYMSSFKNLQGINDGVYNELMNNAYAGIEELADRDDLENIGRHIRTLSGNITNKWGGAKLNESYNDYYSGLQSIKDLGSAYTGDEVGGYAPHMAKAATENFAATFRGVVKDEEGRVVYNKTTPPTLIEYQNYSNVADSLLEGWKADTLIETNEDGTIKIAKPIPGYTSLRVGEVVHEGTLRNMLVRNLNTKGFQDYSKQEAGLRMGALINDVKQAVSNGIQDTEAMKEQLNNMRARYSGNYDATRVLFTELEKAASANNMSLEEFMLASPGALNTLMQATYQDDIAGPAASKYSYRKEELKDYTDHKWMEETKNYYRIQLEEQLKAGGYSTYYNKPGSDPTNPTDSEGIVGATGPNSFAVMVQDAGVEMFANYGLDTLDKLHTDTESSYKNSLNKLNTLKYQKAQGGKVTDEQLATLQKEVEKYDEELTYYNTVRGNIYDNISTILFNKDTNISQQVKKYVKDGTFKSEKQAKDFVIDMAYLHANDTYSKAYITEEYDKIIKKYGLEEDDPNAYIGAGSSISILTKHMTGGKGRGLANTVVNAVSKLDTQGKMDILTPQLPLKYLAIAGETAKNVDLTAYNNSLSLYKDSFIKNSNTFKILRPDGGSESFTSGVETLIGLKPGTLWGAIDESSIAVDPLLANDFMLGKATGNTPQLLVNFKFNRESQVYKDNKDKIDKFNKEGRFKMVVATDPNNANAFSADIATRLQNAFNHLSSTKGFNTTNPDIIKALGMGYATVRGMIPELGKLTFYDLKPDTNEARAVTVRGEKFAITTTKGDYFSTEMDNIDFRIHRPMAGDTQGRYSETLAMDNITGEIKWISQSEYNKGKDKNDPTKNKYKFFKANTPQDIMGVLGAYVLQSQLNEHNQNVVNRNTQLASGGNIRGGSSYPMNKSYLRMAGAIRQAEASGRYNFKPGDEGSMGLGYGGYQFVKSVHGANISKMFNGMTMDEFNANPVAQDKYFEAQVAKYDAFLNTDNRAHKLLQMIKMYYPNANMDYARAAVHFWGEGNILRLFDKKDPYNIHSTKIEYTNKVTGKKGSNPTIIQHLKKFHANYR